MYILKGAFIIVAFSVRVSSVLGGPIQAAYRDNYEHWNDITRYTGDLSGPNKYLAHLSTPIDAKDVDNPVNISACTPSAQDFPNLFNRLQTQTGYNDLSKKLVFWSGVTEEEAQQFAISKNRYTALVQHDRSCEPLLDSAFESIC
ncbi:hypothetical protein H633G_11110 [Metarhizium anisopliae BRIP 53284]|nr:hypothetical protein H633G_11110 [Metarhizium anisopliae BRIP 53284]